jgi:hypothetical protein
MEAIATRELTERPLREKPATHGAQILPITSEATRIQNPLKLNQLHDARREKGDHQAASMSHLWTRQLAAGQNSGEESNGN